MPENLTPIILSSPDVFYSYSVYCSQYGATVHVCVWSPPELTIACCYTLTGYELSQHSYVLLAVVCAFTHRIFLKILLFRISSHL